MLSLARRIGTRRTLVRLDHWLPGALDAATDLRGLCRTVLAYLVTGHRAYRGNAVARVHYPGRGSSNGTDCDSIEGFTRLAPLLAAWTGAGHGDTIELPCGSPVSLGGLLAQGLSAGTSKQSAEYWGVIDAPDQRVCEAADVALSAWLARDELRDRLGETGLSELFSWLGGAYRADVRDNNWHFFPLIVDAVARSFGRDGLSRSQRAFHSHRILAMHHGNGWFRDGQDGPVDYYNSWGFHYSLYWLERIGYPLGDVPYREFAEPFFDSFRWLFTTGGFPMFGRSVCYRMAAPAGLLAASLATGDRERLGLALRAVDTTWRHFIGKGALAAGRITPGFHGTDFRLLDGYSGPASPLWSLRSLVPLAAEPPSSDTWSTPEYPLPIERGDFDVRLEVPPWRIRGHAIEQSVDLFVAPCDNPPGSVPTESFRKQAKTLVNRLLRKSFTRPLRELAYGQARYTTDFPFWRPRSGDPGRNECDRPLGRTNSRSGIKS